MPFVIGTAAEGERENVLSVAEGGAMKLRVAAIQLPAAVENIAGRLGEVEARMRLAAAHSKAAPSGLPCDRR